MPIETFWHNDDKTIVGYRFSGRWTWEEYYQAVETVREMMESVIHQRVDGIIDFTGSDAIPGGSIVHFRKGTSKAADNWGVSVIVTQSRFILTLADVVRKLAPKIADRYYLVDTIDSAFELIANLTTKDASTS